MLLNQLMELTNLQKNLHAQGLAAQSMRRSVNARVFQHLCLLMTGAAVVGCAFNPFQRQQPPVAIATNIVPEQIIPTMLTEQAALALTRAEQSVKDARANHTLWTVAVEKLGQARTAASIFDSRSTSALAEEIIALCTRSAAQAKLPPVTW